MTTTSAPVTPHPTVTAGHDLVPLAGALACIAGGSALLVSFTIVPGPDVADIHDAGWTPGHLLSAVAFGLLALGTPALATSLGRRLGVAGVIGYIALMARYILSTGSHLYSLWILPKLAPITAIHHQIEPQRSLASIYAGHGDWFNLVLAIGMLGLVYCLARCGRGTRVITVLVALAAVSEFLGSPFGLGVLAVVAIWLGLRLLRRGDVLAHLRASQ